MNNYEVVINVNTGAVYITYGTAFNDVAAGNYLMVGMKSHGGIFVNSPEGKPGRVWINRDIITTIEIREISNVK